MDPAAKQPEPLSYEAYQQLFKNDAPSESGIKKSGILGRIFGKIFGTTIYIKYSPTEGGKTKKCYFNIKDAKQFIDKNKNNVHVAQPVQLMKSSIVNIKCAKVINLFKKNKIDITNLDRNLMYETKVNHPEVFEEAFTYIQKELKGDAVAKNKHITNFGCVRNPVNEFNQKLQEGLLKKEMASTLQTKTGATIEDCTRFVGAACTNQAMDEIKQFIQEQEDGVTLEQVKLAWENKCSSETLI